VLQDDRRVRRLAFDALQQLKSALALGHSSRAPTRQPAPCANSTARCRDFPARCSTTSSSAPSPVAMVTALLSIDRTSPGATDALAGLRTISFTSTRKTPGH